MSIELAPEFDANDPAWLGIRQLEILLGLGRSQVYAYRTKFGFRWEHKDGSYASARVLVHSPTWLMAWAAAQFASATSESGESSAAMKEKFEALILEMKYKALAGEMVDATEVVETYNLVADCWRRAAETVDRINAEAGAVIRDAIDLAQERVDSHFAPNRNGHSRS